MKILFLTALLSLSLLDVKAQTSIKMETLQKEDSLVISEKLEKAYFKSIYEGDVKTLGNVFYSGALLFGDVKGQPYKKTLAEYLDGVAHRQSPKDSGKPFKGEIVSIKVVNSIAVAEVRVTMYDFIYHEFLPFHKMNGQWYLVNKMISDTAN